MVSAAQNTLHPLRLSKPAVIQDEPRGKTVTPESKFKTVSQGFSRPKSMRLKYSFVNWKQ